MYWKQTTTLPQRFEDRHTLSRRIHSTSPTSILMAFTSDGVHQRPRFKNPDVVRLFYSSRDRFSRVVPTQLDLSLKDKPKHYAQDRVQ